MGENLIEFHGREGEPFPRPYPANQAIPSWFKQLAPEAALPAGDTIPTLKKCVPFVDALTGGYLIPLPVDAEFAMQPEGLKVSSELTVIDAHPPQQVGPAIGGRVVVKFINPWIIKTPPGYSCMFLPPLNRFEIPFQVLSGIVETDTYYSPINFPAVCIMRPGQHLVLKRGTPIAQVFPFQRERWAAEFTMIQAERAAAADQEFKTTRGRYKDAYWQRKEYR